MSNTVAPATAAPWFDTGTLFTAAGATAAVITVTGVLQALFPDLPGRWVALVLALLIALSAISVWKLPWNYANVFVALINGLTTYAAAIGINTVFTAPPPSAVALAPPQPTQAPARHYRWWP